MLKLKTVFGLLMLLLVFAAPAIHAAEYHWTDANGVSKSLADYKGRNVVLHFWASWCPPCRSEMPELGVWSKAHQDVEIVVVTLDRNINNAVAFLESKNIAFPALQGDMSAAQRLGVRGLPTTLVIDSDGNIRQARIGAVNWNNAQESEAILNAYRSDS